MVKNIHGMILTCEVLSRAGTWVAIVQDVHLNKRIFRKYTSDAWDFVTALEKNYNVLFVYRNEDIESVQNWA